MQSPSPFSSVSLSSSSTSSSSISSAGPLRVLRLVVKVFPSLIDPFLLNREELLLPLRSTVVREEDPTDGEDCEVAFIFGRVSTFPFPSFRLSSSSSSTSLSLSFFESMYVEEVRRDDFSLFEDYRSSCSGMTRTWVNT
jgi:hypothetical protein